MNSPYRLPAQYKIVLVLVLLFSLQVSRTNAQPPQVNDSTPISKMLAPLNPKTWKMPDVRLPKVAFPKVWPAASKKRVVKKKQKSMLKKLSQRVDRGWKSTKQNLNPARMWSEQMKLAKKPNSTKKRKTDSNVGFWAKLWPRQDKPERITTTDEFLKQPRPF